MPMPTQTITEQRQVELYDDLLKQKSQVKGTFISTLYQAYAYAKSAYDIYHWGKVLPPSDTMKQIGNQLAIPFGSFLDYMFDIKERNIYLMQVLPDDLSNYKNTYLFINANPPVLYHIDNKATGNLLTMIVSKFRSIGCINNHNIHESKPLEEQITANELNQFWEIIQTNKGHTRKYWSFTSVASLGVEAVNFSASPVSWLIMKGSNLSFRWAAEEITSYIIHRSKIQNERIRKELFALNQAIACEMSSKSSKIIRETKIIRLADKVINQGKNSFFKSVQEKIKPFNVFPDLSNSLDNTINDILKKLGNDTLTPLTLTKKEIEDEKFLYNKQKEIQDRTDELLKLNNKLKEYEQKIHQLDEKLKQDIKNIYQAHIRTTRTSFIVDNATEKKNVTLKEIKDVKTELSAITVTVNSLNNENIADMKFYNGKRDEFIASINKYQLEKFKQEELSRDINWQINRQAQFKIDVPNIELNIPYKSIENLLNEHLSKNNGEITNDNEINVKMDGSLKSLQKKAANFQLSIPLQVYYKKKILGAKVTPFKIDLLIDAQLTDENEFPTIDIDKPNFKFLNRPKLKLSFIKVASVGSEASKAIENYLPKIQAQLQQKVDQSFNKENLIQQIQAQLPSNLKADNLNIKVQTKSNKENLKFTIGLFGNFDAKIDYNTLFSSVKDIHLSYPYVNVFENIIISQIKNVCAESGALSFEMILSGDVRGTCKFEAVPYYISESDTLAFKNIKYLNGSVNGIINNIFLNIFNNEIINERLRDILVFDGIQSKFREKLYQTIQQTKTSELNFKLDVNSIFLNSINFLNKDINFNFKITGEQSIQKMSTWISEEKMPQTNSHRWGAFFKSWLPNHNIQEMKEGIDDEINANNLGFFA